mmetsp:Transcript_27145/g.30441  ORF Transcript_27145/g.30441 Transcript_27145/m.30441 type:complete len:311 (-) Transcript_27145:386-1318(-)
MAKIDFPYTVDDEPTEEWKVEQVLHWWLLRANSESEAEYETIVDGLTKQLAMGEQTLWEAHAQVTELLGQKNDNTDDHDNVMDMEPMSTTDFNNGNENEFAENENIENVNASNSNNNNNSNNKDQHQQQQQPDGKPTKSVPSKIPSTVMSVDDIMAGKIPTAESIPTATTTTTTTTTASNKSTTKNSNNDTKKPDTIHIDVLDGFYGGTFYDLQPKSRIHAWVGRSQGKKFKQKGISLPKDLEISTTHGRFGYSSRATSGSGFSYTDVGSTNGSRLNGSCCEPNVSYALTTGMEILIGETLLKVTLLALA